MIEHPSYAIENPICFIILLVYLPNNWCTDDRTVTITIIFFWSRFYTHFAQRSFRRFLNIVVPATDPGHRFRRLQEKFLSCVPAASDFRVRTRVLHYDVTGRFELTTAFDPGRGLFVVHVRQPNILYFLLREFVDRHYAQYLQTHQTYKSAGNVYNMSGAWILCALVQ